MAAIIRIWTCILLVAGLAQAGGPIRLKTRTLDPVEDRNEYRAGPLKSRRPGWSHFLLQFRQPPTAGQIEQIRQRGGLVTSRIPDDAVMVAGPDELDFEGLDLRWAGRLRDVDKLSPELSMAAEMLDMPEAAAYVVEFHPDVDMEEARRLVEEHLLTILDNRDLLPHQLLVEGFYDQIAGLAEWDEVAYVFPASEELRDGVPVVGCPGAVLSEGPVGQYVKVGQGWPSANGNGVELQWILDNSPGSITVDATRSEVVRALNEWARYAKLSFVPGSRDGKRTIEILFARGYHGDPYPFDGPGKVLAHTFYPAPPNPEPIAGDMHLDADESWKIGATVDLYTVVLHELGHALGLGHSDRPGSVMYPYYRMTTGLAADDIAGIQDLYGAREADTAPPSAPSDPPVSDPPPSDPPKTDPPKSDPPLQPPQPPKNDPPPAQPPAKPDTVAPSLTITYPGSSMASTSGSSITLRGAASDNVGVAAVRWTNASGGSGDATGTAFWTAAVPLQKGNNAITVRAYDSAGNSSWRSVTVVRR